MIDLKKIDFSEKIIETIQIHPKELIKHLRYYNRRVVIEGKKVEYVKTWWGDRYFKNKKIEEVYNNGLVRVDNGKPTQLLYQDGIKIPGNEIKSPYYYTNSKFIVEESRGNDWLDVYKLGQVVITTVTTSKEKEKENLVLNFDTNEGIKEFIKYLFEKKIISDKDDIYLDKNNGNVLKGNNLKNILLSYD